MLHKDGSKLISALALGACLLLPGCDGTSPEADPAASTGALISACGLLTQAEAEAVFGKPVLSMQEDTTSGYITSCTYKGSTEPDAFLPTRLSITAFTTAGVQAKFHLTVPGYFANLKATTAPADRDSVPGVGTDAFWHKKPGKLSMYKSDVYADISFSLKGTGIDTSAASKSACTAVGVKAAAKI